MARWRACKTSARSDGTNFNLKTVLGNARTAGKLHGRRKGGELRVCGAVSEFVI